MNSWKMDKARTKGVLLHTCAAWTEQRPNAPRAQKMCISQRPCMRPPCTALEEALLVLSAFCSTGCPRAPWPALGGREGQKGRSLLCPQHCLVLLSCRITLTDCPGTGAEPMGWDWPQQLLRVFSGSRCAHQRAPGSWRRLGSCPGEAGLDFSMECPGQGTAPSVPGLSPHGCSRSLWHHQLPALHWLPRPGQQSISAVLHKSYNELFLELKGESCECWCT